ncbi:MAG: outer membrane beta-barrel protein [Ferruginibacter sp.]
MKTLIAVLFLILSVTVNAQKTKTLKFSVGPEIAAVTGNLNKAYSIAIGATAQLDYMISSDAAITANAGLIQLVGKKIANTNTKFQSVTLIPLLVGVKYYFIPKLYGSAQLGTSVSTKTGGSSLFTYIPGVGFKIDEKLDLLLKYTGYSGDGGTFGVRLGYSF